MAEVEYYQGALTGQEIDALPNRLGNRNLLDNWCFLNPVNQLGQTIYNASGSAFTIDRWVKRNTVTVSPQSDGLHLTYADDENLKSLQQPFKNPTIQQLVGKTVTVSVLVKNVSFPTASTSYPKFGLYSAASRIANTAAVVTGIIRGDGLWSATGVIDESVLQNDFLNFAACYSNTYPGTITIVAAKLELGESQTLAHQVNGEWVLNEIPDYHTELLKCMQYQYVVNPLKQTYIYIGEPQFAGNSAGNVIYPRIILPTPLRTKTAENITLTDIGSPILRDQRRNTFSPGSAAGDISVYRITDSYIQLKVNISGLTLGNMYEFLYGTSGIGQFIIDANL